MRRPDGEHVPAIKIVRKPTDDFAGPNDPAATVVTTLYTNIKVINGSYATVTPMPTSVRRHDRQSRAQLCLPPLCLPPGADLGDELHELAGLPVRYARCVGSPPLPVSPPNVPPAPIFTLGRRVLDAEAASGDQRIDLTWRNPAVFEQIKIVRKVDSPPTSLTDGTLVFAGNATSYADTGLTNGTSYFYAIYTVYDGGKLSEPVLVDATAGFPDAPITYRAAPTGSYGGSGGDFNLGAVFHVTEDKVVLKLGRAYLGGSTSGNQIGVWDDETGQLLASAVVSPNAPVAVLSAPVALSAGHRYVIGVKEARHALERVADAHGPAEVPGDRRQRVQPQHQLQLPRAS